MRSTEDLIKMHNDAIQESRRGLQYKRAKGCHIYILAQWRFKIL